MSCGIAKLEMSEQRKKRTNPAEMRLLLRTRARNSLSGTLGCSFITSKLVLQERGSRGVRILEATGTDSKAAKSQTSISRTDMY